MRGSNRKLTVDDGARDIFNDFFAEFVDREEAKSDRNIYTANGSLRNCVTSVAGAGVTSGLQTNYRKI
jgi:hypothetical protein